MAEDYARSPYAILSTDDVRAALVEALIGQGGRLAAKMGQAGAAPGSPGRFAQPRINGASPNFPIPSAEWQAAYLARHA